MNLEYKSVDVLLSKCNECDVSKFYLVCKKSNKTNDRNSCSSYSFVKHSISLVCTLNHIVYENHTKVVQAMKMLF